MDFTPSTYIRLLSCLRQQGYRYYAPGDWFANRIQAGPAVILRHDVDRRPHRALVMARIEGRLGLRAGYFFRYRDFQRQASLIKQIEELGHEIGYHYEELALSKGDKHKAAILFEHNLKEIRKQFPVETLAMHGSPLSRHDNRDLWKYIDYHAKGIAGEVYLDIDYGRVCYFTDTGQKWNDTSANLRDKVQQKWGFEYKTTFDFIQAIEAGSMPEAIMLNIHPNRWNPPGFTWMWEYLWQKAKNGVKQWLKMARKCCQARKMQEGFIRRA